MIAVVSGQPGSTQRYIAETLEMSEASAGRLVDRLCAEGLLERREREDDRRARAVYLTEAAKPLLETLAAIAEASEDRIFKDFSEDEGSKFCPQFPEYKWYFTCPSKSVPCLEHYPLPKRLATVAQDQGEVY